MDRSETHDDAQARPAGASLREHLQELGERECVCPQHGAYTATGRRLFKREIWQPCPACSAEETKQREEELRQAQAAVLSRQRQEAIGEACIPTRFRELTFDSFVAETPAQAAASSQVRRYVGSFHLHQKNGTGLVLAGLPGTGKTHLAAAAMLYLIEQSRAWVHYVTCMGMIRMVRDTWRKDSEISEKKVLALLGERIDLLVIDEVGVQYGTDAEQTVLFEILDRRYSEMRPTILITNQDKEGFKTFIGERVADRLSQTHNWLVFDWPSYRKKARAT